MDGGITEKNAGTCGDVGASGNTSSLKSNKGITEDDKRDIT